MVTVDSLVPGGRPLRVSDLPSHSVTVTQKATGLLPQCASCTQEKYAQR